MKKITKCPVRVLSPELRKNCDSILDTLECKAKEMAFLVIQDKYIFLCGKLNFMLIFLIGRGLDKYYSN